MTTILNTSSWQSEILTRALVARKDCDILAELIVLRDEGVKSQHVENFYETRRRQGSFNAVKTHNPDPMSYIRTFSNALRGIDHNHNFTQTKRFLDLGCSPGGYSTYVLQKNPEATGVGITIPVYIGGPDLHIPLDLLPRIDVKIEDLMNYDLAPSIPKPRNLPPLPVEPASVDLVMADARWVAHPDNLNRPWNWTRLIIAQLVIALRTVQSGGTIFLRLSQVERTLSGRIILAMCRIAGSVECVKSATFQAVRSGFYVLARGVNRDTPDFDNLLIAAERLWYTMSLEGEQGYGRDITDEEEGTITSDEELMSEGGLSKLAQFGVPIWNMQFKALYGFLRRAETVRY